jgi:glycosyltransferase involved in cell wall biosynthesis
MVTVQTRTLADAMAAQTGLARGHIRVIPHGPGWVEPRSSPVSETTRGEGPLRIGYVSKFGIQKNFDVLFRAAKALVDEGLNIRLVLTLDPADASSRAVLAQAQALGLSAILVNHGEVPPEKLSDLYDSLDLFVFPSLCESFGMPMLEAMARGLCVVVADTPENREMVGPAGLTFPPHDWSALAAILRDLDKNDAERAARGHLSLQRAAEFSWAQAAEGTLQALRAVAGHA